MTVFDVAVAGAMVGSVAGHATAVRAWAAAVWQAWAAGSGSSNTVRGTWLSPTGRRRPVEVNAWYSGSFAGRC